MQHKWVNSVDTISLSQPLPFCPTHVYTFYYWKREDIISMLAGKQYKLSALDTQQITMKEQKRAWLHVMMLIIPRPAHHQSQLTNVTPSSADVTRFVIVAFFVFIAL